MSLKEMPQAQESAAFLGNREFEEIPGLVFLLWQTRVGVLAAAYPTSDHGGSHPGWVLEFVPEIQCLIEVAPEGFHNPDGPDVYDEAVEEGEQRQLLWRYYSRAIGRPAP
ncbi:hypothetical protein [Actinokineospora sp. NPDC004072]